MTKKILKILRDWLAFPSILILCYFFIVKPHFDKKDREIIANREYSIAHVIKRYAYGEKAKGGNYGGGTSLESVDFSYKFKGQTLYANCPIDSENGFDKTLTDFLILIHKDDPGRFILLFDYPIKNKSDFERIISKYEKENIKNAP